MECDWGDTPDRLLPQPEAADRGPPGPILLADRAFDTVPTKAQETYCLVS